MTRNVIILGPDNPETLEVHILKVTHPVHYDNNFQWAGIIASDENESGISVVYGVVNNIQDGWTRWNAAPLVELTKAQTAVLMKGFTVELEGVSLALASEGQVLQHEAQIHDQRQMVTDMETNHRREFAD
jgi:hypothetical protein